MITLPLSTSKGNIVGVLQLMNKKKQTGKKWPSTDEKAISEQPLFNVSDERLIKSFGAIAAASLENAQLYTYIENLFDSFVHASVLAIDSRDKGTRGHSERVAKMTTELARLLSETDEKEFEKINFTEVELKKISYAALLHDFGKIGVRESTLSKALKLNDAQMVSVEKRVSEFCFQYEREQRQKLMERCLSLKRVPDSEEIALLEDDIKAYWNKLNGHLEFIKALARPSILDEDTSEKLHLLRGLTFKNLKGDKQTLLTDEELNFLAVKRGCLTLEERKEIESHVTKSYEFLKKIPWGHNLAEIPQIAYAHHEALDGTGYPRGLTEKQIPLEAKILSVCDIFDALAANDRSYKKALPIEKNASHYGKYGRAKQAFHALHQVFP